MNAKHRDTPVNLIPVGRLDSGRQLCRSRFRSGARIWR